VIQKIVVFFIIIYTYNVNSQESDDIIDNSWNEYLHCLKINTFEIIKNQELLKLEIMNNNQLSKLEILKLIGKSYTDDSNQMIESSIEKAFINLPIILKHVNKKWEISSHLENLFFINFNEEYVKFHNLKPCRKIEEDYDYADYRMVLESTKNMINIYHQKLNTKLGSNKNHLQYPIYDYFFKIAVLNYKPDLNDYVTLKVLQKKKLKRMNDKEKHEELLYLWEL
jgi:hypothetical protein